MTVFVVDTNVAIVANGGRGTSADESCQLTCAGRHLIPVVPVLFKGEFRSVEELRAFIEDAHAEPSVLGGAREGVVVRRASGFPASGFPLDVCKSVRAGHVQSDAHWTRSWRPCKIARNHA